MSRNQMVSSHSLWSWPSYVQYFIHPAQQDVDMTIHFSLWALLSFAGHSKSDASGKAGTFSLHSTHGMMKYRGSTKGAVMSESVVEMSQMRVNEVFGNEDALNESDGADCSGRMVIAVPFLSLAKVVSGRGGQYPAKVRKTKKADAT
jgi:hypothetical protein